MAIHHQCADTLMVHVAADVRASRSLTGAPATPDSAETEEILHEDVDLDSIQLQPLESLIEVTDTTNTPLTNAVIGETVAQSVGAANQESASSLYGFGHNDFEQSAPSMEGIVPVPDGFDFANLDFANLDFTNFDWSNVDPSPGQQDTSPFTLFSPARPSPPALPELDVGSVMEEVSHTKSIEIPDQQSASNSNLNMPAISPDL